ncbi:Predicted DNA-binding protein, MmcQ/YjbR family [Kaistella treverensis]|uniref:Predicted DNA-binding protein, MmcQ/YjbR family n=1 Tax=Kaistella treverensis TaxID=631455 RepID=A0A1I3K129_9FLAO|nr:MmcQ/YjbR family DNA-binding protein [Kaistella treverensis]SFI66020.1 Predicted DNA-binding protein, MmcQ/YjbR family [Kaistella treverensis]
MDVTEILNHCQTRKGVEETFPFGPDALVLKVGGKMFMLIALESEPLTISVKTHPEWSAELREKHPQIAAAYHMNKTHWSSVVCEGLKRELILEMIDHSYDLVFSSLTKNQKEAVNNS